MASVITFKNTDIALSFGMTGAVFILKSILGCDGTEYCAVTSAPPPLWKIEFIDAGNQISAFVSDIMPEEVQEEPGRLLMSWHCPNGAKVIVEAVADRRGDQALLGISVENVPAGVSLRHIHFPCYDWILTDGDECRLIVPEDAGAVYPDPLKTVPCDGVFVLKGLRNRGWPNGSLSLQFLALERRGVVTYIGARDFSGTIKSFAWTINHEDKCLNLRPNRHCVRRNGASLTSFKWEISLFGGDWFDAANRYRRSVKNAPWLKCGPLAGGKKTPQWFIETPLVTLRLFNGPGFQPEDILSEQEFFGVPMLVHYYAWNQDALLFPTLPGFREAVKTLRAAGVKVMPYTDVYSRGNADALWPSLAHMAVEKDEEKHLIGANWFPGRDLVTMCVDHPLWRELSFSWLIRLVELGCGGIYHDEFGMSPPQLCCSERHGHEPGDPTAFIRGTNTLFENLREESRTIDPEGTVFASEGAGEPFISAIDTFLVGNGNSPYMKPIWSVVYHDYVMGYGRYMFFPELNDPVFEGAIESKNAQQFVCGYQLGWNRVPWNYFINRAPKTAAFIRMLARVRHEEWKYLVCGRMLRPLELEVPMVTRHWARAWNDGTGTEVKLPAVLNSVWRAADGTVGILFVNISKEEQRFETALPSVQWGDGTEVLGKSGPENYRYPLPEPTPCKATVYTMDGSEETVVDGNTFSGLHLLLPPQSVMLIRIPMQPEYMLFSE